MGLGLCAKQWGPFPTPLPLRSCRSRESLGIWEGENQVSLMLEGWGRDQEGLRRNVLICGPLPRSLPRRGPLDTIFSQGERAAPGWYAALGIPLEGARACPFWVVSRPPAAPGEGGPAGREPRSPCREGSGAPRLPAGLRPGAGPAHRLGFLLWPVCVCVTEGREMGRRRRARQRESERDWSQRHRDQRA